MLDDSGDTREESCDEDKLPGDAVTSPGTLQDVLCTGTVLKSKYPVLAAATVNSTVSLHLCDVTNMRRSIGSFTIVRLNN
jgi:hypothetical protein